MAARVPAICAGAAPPPSAPQSRGVWGRCAEPYLAAPTHEPTHPTIPIMLPTFRPSAHEPRRHTRQHPGLGVYGVVARNRARCRLRRAARNRATRQSQSPQTVHRPSARQCSPCQCGACPRLAAGGASPSLSPAPGTARLSPGRVQVHGLLHTFRPGRPRCLRRRAARRRGVARQMTWHRLRAPAPLARRPPPPRPGARGRVAVHSIVRPSGQAFRTWEDGEGERG
jgi:hypothetical protein